MVSWLACAAVEVAFEVGFSDPVATGRNADVRYFSAAAFVPERGF